MSKSQFYQFNIQSDSDIPAQVQLLDQLQFAIASNQYQEGDRLPSTRQLAMITGLHRNTISKVYQQLEAKGLVESVTGSGIYVKNKPENLPQNKASQLQQIVRETVDNLLNNGCSLSQIKDLFTEEINGRIKCANKVLVVVAEEDLGVGELMVSQLQNSLGIPITLTPLKDLIKLLEKFEFFTIITTRYFLQDIDNIIKQYEEKKHLFRIFPLDINDYSQELEIIKKLPTNSCVGLVSLSSGILRVAEVLISSLRGEDILVLTAQINDTFKLKALIRSANIIISDQGSYSELNTLLKQEKNELIRNPKIIQSADYINPSSIQLLNRQLGL